MAQIGLNIFITGLSGKMLVRWVKPATPLAEVGRSAAYDFPVDVVYSLPTLQPVVYNVQIWRSNDGVALDQLLKEWSIDASKSTRATIWTYQYKVGRGWNNTSPVNTGVEAWADPTDGQILLTDERLDGYAKENMIVHEQGFGNKLDEAYNLVSGGGIELVSGAFNEDTGWFITVSDLETVEIGGGGVGIVEEYDGVLEIDEDKDFIADELANKLCYINAETPTVKVNIDDLTLIPDGTKVAFVTDDGMQNYLILQFDAGDTIRFKRRLVNIIYLAPGERIKFWFKGGNCYVDSYDGNESIRGMIMWDYDSTRDSDYQNILFADEATGVLEKVDYPGLYAFVAQLSGDAVCQLGSGLGQWSYTTGGKFPNKVKYGIDVTSEIFRVPHLSGMSIKANVSPGKYDPAQVGEISESFNFKQGKSDDNESGVSGEYLRKPGASGGTNYGNTAVTFLFNSGKTNAIDSVSNKPYVIL